MFVVSISSNYTKFQVILILKSSNFCGEIKFVTIMFCSDLTIQISLDSKNISTSKGGFTEPSQIFTLCCFAHERYQFSCPLLCEMLPFLSYMSQASNSHPLFLFNDLNNYYYLYWALISIFCNFHSTEIIYANKILGPFTCVHQTSVLLRMKTSIILWKNFLTNSLPIQIVSSLFYC